METQAPSRYASTKCTTFPVVGETDVMAPATTIVDEIEGMIDDMELFFNQFCESARAAIPSRSASPSVQERGAEQAAWEKKRLQVEAGMQQQVELLTDAWQRLEAEQRDSTERQRQVQQPAAASQQTDPPPLQTIQSNVAPSCVASLPQASGRVTSAAQDFEKLRREIQSRRFN